MGRRFVWQVCGYAHAWCQLGSAWLAITGAVSVYGQTPTGSGAPLSVHASVPLEPASKHRPALFSENEIETMWKAGPTAPVGATSTIVVGGAPARSTVIGLTPMGTQTGRDKRLRMLAERWSNAGALRRQRLSELAPELFRQARFDEHQNWTFFNGHGAGTPAGVPENITIQSNAADSPRVVIRKIEHALTHPFQPPGP